MNYKCNYFIGLLERLDTKSECKSMLHARFILGISHFTDIILFQDFVHRLEFQKKKK
jgi:hypothetical protein